MQQLIINIETNGLFLKKHRGFLIAEKLGEEVSRVVIDDLACVIVSAHGITYTNNLMVSLAENNVPVIFCDRSYSPVAVLQPVVMHQRQGNYIRQQVGLSLPAQKRCWQNIVKSKIAWQAHALRVAGQSGRELLSLVDRVKSGDPTNVEANAAQRYWKLLFGKDFRRDRQKTGANAQLNYGYAVLRGAATRAILATGLHPSISLHHSAKINPLALADDLMEPFRPLVDLRVKDFFNHGNVELDAYVKQELGNVMHSPIDNRSDVPMTNELVSLCHSLRNILTGEQNNLEVPLPNLRLGPKNSGYANEQKHIERISADVDVSHVRPARLD